MCVLQRFVWRWRHHAGAGRHDAFNVVARRPARKGTVRLAGHELHFLPRDKQVSIVDISAKTTRLEKDFRQLLKHSVRVRSVIAVPGWHAESQASEGHLIVNERTLPMFRGWKDEADYLEMLSRNMAIRRRAVAPDAVAWRQKTPLRSSGKSGATSSDVSVNWSGTPATGMSCDAIRSAQVVMN